MDKIDKFEKILNLVERARKLDFIAIEVMEKMNKQHIDFYNFYNTIIQDKQNQKETKETKKEMEVDKKETIHSNADIDKKKITDIEKEKEINMTDHNEALKAFVDAFNNQINKCKLNPSGPIPPEDEEEKVQQQAQPAISSVAQEHLVKMDKIKGYSAIICDRIKTQADMLKYMQSVISETHKIAFETYKEMDDYLKKNPPPTTGTPKT